MPNRILKESICTSDSIDKLNAFQETVFYRLIVNCDDFGRYDARTKILAARLFPLRDIKTAQIEDALRALVDADLVMLYKVDGKPYVQMKSWEHHQQIRNKQSKYPSIEDADENGAIDGDCTQLISIDSKSHRNPIQSESNPNLNTNTGQTRRGASLARPTLEEVKEYCKERGNKVDAEKWFNYYESNGWKVGRNPMRDWRACVRTWEKNGYDTKHGDQGKSNPALEYQRSDIDEDTFGKDFFVDLDGAREGA